MNEKHLINHPITYLLQQNRFFLLPLLYCVVHCKAFHLFAKFPVPFKGRKSSLALLSKSLNIRPRITTQQQFVLLEYNNYTGLFCKFSTAAATSFRNCNHHIHPPTRNENQDRFIVIPAPEGESGGLLTFVTWSFVVVGLNLNVLCRAEGYIRVRAGGAQCSLPRPPFYN